MKIALTLSVLALSSSLLAKQPTVHSLLDKKLTKRNDWGQISRGVDDYRTLGTEEDVRDDTNIISLHHTATGGELADEDGNLSPQSERTALHAIEDLHIKKYKWDDLAYHFLVGSSGTLYEGRNMTYVGAHTKGLNRKNIALAFVGCYDSVGCPAEGYKANDFNTKMQNAAARLIATISIVTGLPITSDHVVLRSDYEQSKTGQMRFPYSPGEKVRDAHATILSKAKAEKNQILEKQYGQEL